MKNYTYDSANRLITVNSPSSTVELSYNGLGQRLSMDAAGVIAQYVMDGDRPLTAESSGNTTFYLYGLGAIGEKTNQWAYSLPDRTNTPRQLSDLSGEITLSARYTPWGDTLDTYGTGNFSYGYLGGLLDAATGLLYVGNGQYYDPSTGRFLTRDVNPNSPNPYVPWNPIGVIVGPLGLIALIFGRNKKGGKTGAFLVLLLVAGTILVTITACGPTPTPSQEQTQVPTIPPQITPSSIPTQTPSAGDCQNPYRPDGTFDYQAFESCRFKGTTFSGTYLRRTSDAATFLHFDPNNPDDNDPCLEAGPTSRGDACIYFQKRENVVAVVIHHTGGAISNFENLLPGYLDPSSLLDRVDYPFHFLIKNTNEVYEGRAMLIRGSHATGGNFGSIGIELEGDFTFNVPADPQIDTTIKLINAIKAEGVNLKFLSAHRDIERTECPGDAFYGSDAFERISRETGLAYVPNPINWGLVYP